MKTSTTHQLEASQVQEVRLCLDPEFTTYERRIGSSQPISEFFRSIWDEGEICLRERFAVVYLTNNNYIRSYQWISSGGITGTYVDLRLIFATALKLGNVTSIVIAHNHPSGNLKPSEADLKLTKKIKAAGDVLDIHLLDHIILTYDGYYSFADMGQI